MEKKVPDLNEIVQYYVVNAQLTMSPEKLAAQVAHVAINVSDYCQKREESGLEDVKFYRAWCDSDHKKIILYAKEKELLKLIDQGWFWVRDNGLTEIPPDSLTVVAYYPRPRHEVHPKVKRFQTKKRDKALNKASNIESIDEESKKNG